MQQAYEAFEHTADIGLHVYGITLADLFVNAAAGMESLLVAPQQVRARVRREVRASGHDAVSLLIAWLGELIVLFDTEFLLFSQFEIVSIAESEVTGVATGEPYDRERHDLSSAIKAVTWHEAAVERTPTGYQAHIIFDI